MQNNQVAGCNIINNYNIVQQNITNNIYNDCSVYIEINAPINEYNKLVKHYKDNFENNNNKLTSLYNSLNVADKTEKNKIKRQIQKLENINNPPDISHYLSESENRKERIEKKS